MPLAPSWLSTWIDTNKPGASYWTLDGTTVKLTDTSNTVEVDLLNVTSEVTAAKVTATLFNLEDLTELP